MRAHLFYYRIRKDSRKRDMFPNPSGILRRVGYRVDGSVWVIPTDLLPHSLILEMSESAGVSAVNAAEFSQDEATNLVATAKREISQYVRDAVNMVGRKSQTEYDPEKWASTEDFEKWVAAQVRKDARRAARLLADYRHCAEGFGLTEEDLNLREANGQIRIIETLARNRARIYVQAAKELRKAGNSLAGAAENNGVPGYALADALRDSGNDEMADAVEEAFVG